MVGNKEKHTPEDLATTTEGHTDGSLGETVSEAPPKKAPRKSGHKKRKFLVIVAACIGVLAITSVSLVCCSRSNAPVAHQPVMSQPKYTTQEAAWNEIVTHGGYPARFRLYGERGGSDENIVSALNTWLKAFAMKPDAAHVDELTRMEKELGKTTFHMWEEFRRAHYRGYPLELRPDMDANQLAEALNDYIGVKRNGVPLDYISPKTVQTIVYMNSLCAYFEGNIKELHRDGIDTRIHSCQELATQNAYPHLDALIR